MYLRSMHALVGALTITIMHNHRHNLLPLPYPLTSIRVDCHRAWSLLLSQITKACLMVPVALCCWTTWMSEAPFFFPPLFSDEARPVLCTRLLTGYITSLSLLCLFRQSSSSIQHLQEAKRWLTTAGQSPGSSCHSPLFQAGFA